MFAGTGNGTLSIFEANGREGDQRDAGCVAGRHWCDRAASATAVSAPTAEFDAMEHRALGHADAAESARILLMLALTKTSDPKEIRQIL